MLPRVRVLQLLVVVVALSVASTFVAASTATADQPAAGPRAVDAAQLRWGLSDEANNRAFAPDTVNHFSAGRIADPGSGNNILAAAGAVWSNGRPAGWSASSGNVAIEKFNGTAYRPATWAGLTIDSSGTPLASPVAGTFSDHQIVFSGGIGTVDVAAGTASIRWTGDATVLFYSGMSFFYLSDPRLEVEGGVGTLRATLGGFGSSQSDPGAWTPLPASEVTIADLGPVDLSLQDGFTITPRYLGVAVSGVAQTTGDYFGSFPQSFVDFQQRAGSAGFWHSSGGAADRFKQALPVTISYDAARAVQPPAPTRPPTTRPDRVENPIKKPPARRSTPSPPTRSSPAQRSPAVAPANGISPALPIEAPAVPVGPAFQQVAQPFTTLAAAADIPPSDPSGAPWWWLGAALFTVAGSLVGATFRYSAARRR